MIPHPKVEALVGRFGNTAEGRQQAREEMARVILRYARAEAVLAGLSRICASRARQWGPRHVPCGGGGYACLCPCHDPVPPAPVAPAGTVPT